MDYKTTILKKEIQTDETLLPEIAGLHFGFLEENRAVFDYTAYIEENKLIPIDFKVFMRANKHFIETLAKSNDKKTSELFFQNTNGHILVSAELAFIFLAFVNPEMFLYFNSLLTDVITDGVAYSNGFVYSMTANRIPSDVLSDLSKKERMTQPEVNNKPTTIVAFDSSYVLVAIFKSISEAATLTNTVRQSLIKAAYGDIISVNKRYWRAIPPDFQIEPDDVGKLTLFEFDAAVGEDRKIYSTRKMLKNSVMLESEYIALQAAQGR